MLLVSKRSAITLALCVLSLVAVSQQATYKTYTNSQTLGNTVTVNWLVDGDYVYFKITKAAAGPVVFGIGKSMSDADVVAIERPTTTSVSIQDCLQKSSGAPTCSGTSTRWMWATSAAESSEATATGFTVELKRLAKYTSTSESAGIKYIYSGSNSIIFQQTSGTSVAPHATTVNDRGAMMISFTGGNLQAAASSASIFKLLGIFAIFILSCL